MVVEEFHEIKSFKQSKWLEKYSSFITQKQNRVKKIETAFCKLLVDTAFGKILEYVSNRLETEFY